jgi:hypothetical protein
MVITSDSYDDAGLFPALRTTGTASQAPRGLPSLAYSLERSPNPWIVWCGGGILLWANNSKVSSCTSMSFLDKKQKRTYVLYCEITVL